MEKMKVLRRSVLLHTVDGERLLVMAKTVEVGAVLTYAAVKDALSIDMQRDGRRLWMVVQKTLAEEDRMQFACVHNVGYQRLDDDDKVIKSGKFIGQAVRRVRAAGRVIVTVERSRLSEQWKLALDVQNAVIGAMQTVAKPAIMATRGGPTSKEELDRIIAGVRALG